MAINKKGSDKVLGVYWFAILIIISVGIFAIVYSFQVPYDIRSVETIILSENVAECISPLGILDSEIFSLGNIGSGFDYNSVVGVNSEELKKGVDYSRDNFVNNRKCNCGDSCEVYSNLITWKKSL